MNIWFLDSELLICLYDTCHEYYEWCDLCDIAPAKDDRGDNVIAIYSQ